MIQHPTVLVLGAGASSHLDYPMGAALKHEIITQSAGAAAVLEKLGRSPQPLKEFCEALRLSGKQSVDSFLEHRKEFLEVGKIAIAERLIKRENQGKLFDNDGDWYGYLFRRMNSRFEEFLANQLVILTYNYDRSLEAFLYTALTNSYKRPEEETTKALNSLVIIHLHGSLGSLPWQKTLGRHYQQNVEPQQVALAAAGIKVVHEAAADSEEFNKARLLLSNAKRVIFAGFGYGDDNVKRLQPATTMLNKALFVWGTAHGLMTAERQGVEQAFGQATIRLGRKEDKILDFFRETVAL